MYRRVALGPTGEECQGKFSRTAVANLLDLMDHQWPADRWLATSAPKGFLKPVVTNLSDLTDHQLETTVLEDIDKIKSWAIGKSQVKECGSSIPAEGVV